MIKRLLIILAFLFLPLTAHSALIGTLQDNFNDNSIDAAKWTEETDGHTIAEVNGDLESTTITSGGYAFLYSTNNYDFTGGQATIKLVDAGNQALASFYYTPLQVSSEVDWVQGGTVWVIHLGTISTSNTYSETYDADTYRYLRIRESGGTTYFDYSADGVIWTNADSMANPYSSLTTIKVFLSDSYSEVELSTTTAKVDDFNILPSGYSGWVTIEGD